MLAFNSTKPPLSKLLHKVVEEEIQLPDFQRGWVCYDAHIQSLLVSIARSFTSEARIPLGGWRPVLCPWTRAIP